MTEPGGSSYDKCLFEAVDRLAIQKPFTLVFSKLAIPGLFLLILGLSKQKLQF